MSDLISRQAAIDALRDYLVGKRCPDDGTLTCRLIENEVINKLPPIQPEPCEDAVSRKAIIDWIDECQNHADKLYGYEEKALANVKRFITSLPSVTPKQRTGEWIPIEGQWHCSVCDGIAPKGYRWAYCPSCGAKMEVTT